jgi:hypothetical protein
MFMFKMSYKIPSYYNDFKLNEEIEEKDREIDIEDLAMHNLIGAIGFAAVYAWANVSNDRLQQQMEHVSQSPQFRRLVEARANLVRAESPSDISSEDFNLMKRYTKNLESAVKKMSKQSIQHFNGESQSNTMVKHKNSIDWDEYYKNKKQQDEWAFQRYLRNLRERGGRTDEEINRDEWISLYQILAGVICFGLAFG